MRSFLRSSLLIAGVCVLLLTAGCTGSDVLLTGNSGVIVRVVVSNPDARFDAVSQMLMTQINVRPNNPDADRALGQFPVGVLATTDDIINVDFRNEAEEDPSQIVLSSGSYRINKLQFANLLLVQQDRPTSWTDCSEFFAWSFPRNSQGQEVVEFSAAELGSQADIYIQGDGQDEIAIELDAAAFIEAYTHSWVCTSPPNPVPLTFDRTGFKALSPTYLHIRG